MIENSEVLSAGILIIGLVLVIGILLFLAFRDILCWYWKINDNLKNLSEINNKLSIIINKIEEIENKKLDKTDRYA